MAALIDPTVAGNYPVILGDGLTGEDSNEIFTGVRYNHKPALSSSDGPDRARVKPSVPGKTSSYDLTYTDDDDDSYAFSGPRSTDNDQYVLYFDPARQAFILDKVDSTFNMNVTRMPGSDDSEELSRRFPHLDVDDPAHPKSKPTSAPKPAPATARRKVEKKPPKNLALPAATAPAPEPAPAATSKPKSKRPADDEDEDEDDDDDGGLMIEYPEGPPAAAAKAARHNDFSPAFPTQRRFDDYMDERESEADADSEGDDIDMEADFKLPSPVNTQQQQNGHREDQNGAASEDEDDEDGGTVDLEADLENAFEDLANSQEEGGRDDESEISEED
ncbi:Transcription elognation factor Eaf [Cordyceps fumosorosea ARSEF 2679]|uniref:Transcription elognation factor Eaf n=1 Tax=Cordyceps fumosorosea (strain ARSEF 2679) TaxID=1081104 RepID=A0A167NJP7_CORFA|nr:Transcription elognation factor Eaf [Cordyceps fumosorosea ARSEF 2679]OAA55622.1 Transcription elognation factor Eaf [Cordyceps fumosorosea ARSEF 2679]